MKRVILKKDEPMTQQMNNETGDIKRRRTKLNDTTEEQ